MLIIRIIFFLSLLFQAICSFSADTSTAIFNPDFRTLKVGVEGDFLSPPVITLNSDEKLVISFDELSDERSYLRYRLIHCNYDWQPSRLLDSEFTNGFNIDDIDDFAFSSNTFIHFVNYRITIPNEHISPLVSGNYLLQVFPEEDEDDIILQARFYISEGTVSVTGNASSRTDKGYNNIYQQLSLSIKAAGTTSIRDPYSDLILVVEQNGSPFRTTVITHPQRVSGNEIIYEHIPGLIFPAGNEFRRFETVRASYPGLGTDSVRYDNGVYHAYLSPGQQRVSGEYEYDQTQFGRFLVREYNSTDSDLGADYVTVHFTLESPEFIGASVYVDGEMTHHSISDRYKMRYDPQKGFYSLELPLKQGAYNYRYVVVPDNYRDAKADPSPIEGDFYETRNEYGIKIYLRTPGSRSDKLIGNAVIYSFN